MQVNPVGSSQSQTNVQQPQSSVGDYNTFLQLLVTELKNQDPTKPMDPTQTVTQLATFSSVEQSVQANKLLSSLLDTSRLDQATNAIGKSLTSSDGTVTGVVKSVSLTSSGLVATLDTGNQVTIAPGVTIS